MSSPVVVNTPDYSADLTRVDSYPLGDDASSGASTATRTSSPLRPISTAWTSAALWADRSLERPVIVDVVGSRAAPAFRPLSPWVAGFLDFVRDWVRDENGSGAIGFVWRWYGANTMTESSGG